jgi:Kef-type K+ transport system membrane component KefB
VAAATAVSDVLLDLFLVLLAAKVGDEVFKRIGQPAIVGEILAGVLVGPSVLGIVELGEVLEVFAELGVIFLLFWVGLETRISEMRAVGSTALSVGTIGVVLPFAGGIGLALAMGEETGTAVFLGAALAATSVGITSAVLIQLGLTRTRAARTLLGAAIIDDILALILVAVATGIAAEGGLDSTELLVVIGLALAFVAFFALGGTRLMARRPQILHRPRFSESPLLPAVILCLGVAVLAAQIGLAAIIGAFLAGLMVAETKEQHPIEDEVAPLYAFFPPFFFAAIGIQLDLGALVDGETIALLAAVTAVAALTKLAGAWIGAWGLERRETWIVAVGMVPRGEVGIIIAGIGAAAGVVDEQLFAVVVAMSILTTIAVPPVLRRLRDTGG